MIRPDSCQSCPALALRGLLPCHGTDGHVTAVVACCFLEGGGGNAGGGGGGGAERAAALTADSRGRVLHHNVAAYLSLTSLLAGVEEELRVCVCAWPLKFTVSVGEG